MSYVGYHPSLIRSLDCCASMNPDKCKECAYQKLDNPKCMITLLEAAKDSIIREDNNVKNLEGELRQARLGTNYGKQGGLYIHCRYYKPEMDVLKDLCKDLYKLPNRGAGGMLHIMLDDNNIPF